MKKYFVSKLKNLFVKCYLKLYRFGFRLLSLNNRELHFQIKKNQSTPPEAYNKPLRNLVCFIMSIKIATPEREEIMQTTLRECFKELVGQKIQFFINDSSDDYYYARNLEFFQSLNSVECQVRRGQIRLPGSYYDFLSSAKQPYCLTIFDDFPIIHLTPEFLSAACRLLELFSGQVTAVPIELMLNYEINDEAKEIKCNLGDMVYKTNGIKPLATMDIGGQKFLVCENDYYGFYFSTLLVPTRDHAERLKWYLDHISRDNPHKIELAGLWKKGPVHNYLALPVGPYRFDLDWHHTEISIRPAVEPAFRLYQALKNNYRIVEQSGSI